MYKVVVMSKIKPHSDSDSDVDQLGVIKTNQAFRGYAISYKVEIIEKKDLIVQLEASKSSIKDLYSDLLNKTKGFNYQITVKVLLKKYKLNGEIRFAPVYFISLTKIVINYRFRSERFLFQKLYTWLMFGLMKDLAGMLNQSSLNALTFPLTDRYQEVVISTYLLNWEVQEKD